jgi:hypothetical protein
MLFVRFGKNNINTFMELRSGKSFMELARSGKSFMKISVI